MTISADEDLRLNLHHARRLSRRLLKNPATVFVLGFSVLLTLAAVELIEGNAAGANAVGVFAFVLLVIGVTLHATSVVKGFNKV